MCVGGGVSEGSTTDGDMYHIKFKLECQLIPYPALKLSRSISSSDHIGLKRLDVKS